MSVTHIVKKLNIVRNLYTLNFQTVWVDEVVHNQDFMLKYII